MLLASLVIVIWSGVVLCGYYFGKAVEKRLATHSALAGVIQSTLSALATGIMLGTAADPKSLESQACANQAPAGVGGNTVCFLQVHYRAHEGGNCRTLAKRGCFFRLGWER
jgi:hypothetical protein